MVATCLPNLALADDNKSFNIKLDKITVTATKTPIKIEEVPIGVDILSNEDLRVKANSDNLYDALKIIPGSFSSSSSMGWGDIRIRGFTPAILLNGKDSRHFATTYAFDSNLVDMSVVERIEIFKGPQSTMHGGRAISGGHKCYYEKRRQRESVFGYKNRL